MNPSDPFQDGLSYQAQVPLVWRSLDSDQSMEALHSGNEQTLRLLAAVEEYYPDSSEDHSQNHDYARLELKLNMVLELVGQLLAAQHPLPPARGLRLNAHGAEWRENDATPPQVDDRLLLEVYLSPDMPRALRLPVRVRHVQSSVDGALVTAEVEPLSESVVELLEKFIFRRHRRSIAHSRPKPRPSDD